MSWLPGVVGYGAGYEMSSSEVRSFTDPGEFAAAIRGASIEISDVSRGDFVAGITRIDFDHLWMQGFSEEVPRLIHSADAGARVKFAFHTRPGPALRRGGAEVNASSIARVARNHSYFQRSFGPTCWGAISLPQDDLPSIEAAIGRDLTPPTDEVIVTPPPDAMTRLQHLHLAAGQVAEHAPELLAHSEAARGLEQALLDALLACLKTEDVRDCTFPQRRHQSIMRRFYAALEADPDRPLYVLELAQAICVPVRTLSVCCHEQLGIGAKQYLMLRRMHLVRRALRMADPTTTTVTEIATQYGFWQFGRFAGEYRSLFGELPSATLRMPRGGRTGSYNEGRQVRRQSTNSE